MNEPISNDILVKEILETGKKVSSIETMLRTFVVKQASMESDIKAIREDVDGLKSKRKTDRAFIAGVVAVLSPLAAFAVGWVRQFFNL